MRHLWRASLLGLPFLMTATEVNAWGPGGYARKVDLGKNCVISFGGAPQAGPWYLYWPYEAHFNVSAPPFGSGCTPCGMSWGWMGGNYSGAMNWDGTSPVPGAYGGGAPGYGGACPGGSCMVPHRAPQYPNAPMPQTPAMARPTMPMPNTQPAGFQPASFMTQVPSYWYGK